MSRTDKDRPYWVRTWQDDHFIDHDHRNGVCIEDSLEYDRMFRGQGWRRGTHHDCKKSVRVEFRCQRMKVDGRKTNVYLYDGELKWKRDIANVSCWAWRCHCDHGEYWKNWYESTYCPYRYFVECAGHYTYERHPEIPCSCDETPPVPTCNVTPVMNRSRYCWGGVPTAFVRTVYHGPERAREQKLRDMAREYNAYGDIEDDDFVNRQGRGSARWDWW